MAGDFSSNVLTGVYILYDANIVGNLEKYGSLKIILFLTMIGEHIEDIYGE